MRRALTLTATVLALSACKVDNDVLQTWRGAPESRLLSVWGTPSDILETQQGTRILTYRRERKGSDLAVAEGSGLRPAGGPDAREAAYCETTFTVQDHRIVGFVHSGRGC